MTAKRGGWLTVGMIAVVSLGVASACGGSNSSPTPTPTPGLAAGDFPAIFGGSDTAGAASTFFQKELGDTWTPVVWVPYDSAKGEIPDRAKSDCAKAGESVDDYRENAFACSTDHHIAYDMAWMRQLLKEDQGKIAVEVILMHEMSHKYDYESNHRGHLSAQEENQADCGAGRAAKNAADNGLMQGVNGIITGALTFHSQAVLASAWWTKGAHGSPSDRFDAYLTGWGGTPDDCRAIGEAKLGATISTPPFKVDLVRDATAEVLPNKSTVMVTMPKGHNSTGYLTGYKSSNTEGAANVMSRVWANYWGNSDSAAPGSDLNGAVVPVIEQGETIPVDLSRALRSANDSVAARTYTWTDNSTRYDGLFVVIERSGDGILVISTVAPNPGNDEQNWAALMLVNGVEP